MTQLKNPITRTELKTIAADTFVDMVKAVADVRRNLLAVGAELHSDMEALLLDDGSAQEDLWGINLYVDLEGRDFVEFDSMINVRPSQGNRSRDVEDEALRRKILDVVSHWVRA